MTTIDPKVAAGPTVASADRTTGASTSVSDWLTTSDHKKIGRLFMGSSLALALAVAALGALLGFERLDAESTSLDVDALPQLFSLFRIVLTFGVVTPFLLGLAIAVVPLQVGARALAFPRLAAAGFWTWLIGAGLVVGSIAANGGPSGGNSDMVDLFLASHVLVVIGLVAAAIAVAASVLTTRAPGMNMRRVPLFSWSALVSSLGLILMLPVLAGALVLLYLDHRGPRTTFGGNLGVGSWIDFAFTQPATFVYALPAFGIAADVIATSTRRRLKLRGVALTGLGLIGAATFAGVSQVDAPIRPDVRDLSFGQVVNDVLPYALFNLLPILGALVVLAVGLLALASGRPRINSPLLFAFFGVFHIVVGMLGNAVYQIGDARLAGTVFEEGAWIYVMYGALLAGLGGVTYWGPKLWGRTIGDVKAIPLAMLGALAVALASLPHYIAGFAKQPAGATEFDYSGPQEIWNGAVMIGHVLMAVTLLAFIGLALASFTKGKLAGDDPWDGQTLEWATASPAPTHNFAEVHSVASAEPLLDLKPTAAAGSGTAGGKA